VFWFVLLFVSILFSLTTYPRSLKNGQMKFYLHLPILKFHLYVFI